jgi:hypothetical protein
MRAVSQNQCFEGLRKSFRARAGARPPDRADNTPVKHIFSALWAMLTHRATFAERETRKLRVVTERERGRNVHIGSTSVDPGCCERAAASRRRGGLRKPGGLRPDPATTCRTFRLLAASARADRTHHLKDEATVDVEDSAKSPGAKHCANLSQCRPPSPAAIRRTYRMRGPGAGTPPARSKPIAAERDDDARVAARIAAAVDEAAMVGRGRAPPAGTRRLRRPPSPRSAGAALAPSRR